MFQVLLFNISNSIYQVISDINNLHIVVWFQVTDDNNTPPPKIYFLNRSIQHIDGILTGISTLVRVDLGVLKEYSAFHKLQKLAPHYQMLLKILSRTQNSFRYCNLTLIILFLILHLFAHS